MRSVLPSSAVLILWRPETYRTYGSFPQEYVDVTPEQIHHESLCYGWG